jgi:hypothetical protein|tara:strand:+ start:8555 stop:8746 length:192 start_codon:yes stop_codon:yes gene_type:complete
MKKKRSLIEPSKLEQNIQLDFSAIISSAPDEKAVEKIIPKIKDIAKRLKKRKAKHEVRRLMKQ